MMNNTVSQMPMMNQPMQPPPVSVAQTVKPPQFEEEDLGFGNSSLKPPVAPPPVENQAPPVAAPPEPAKAEEPKKGNFD
jgi:hypothetical protein